MKKISYCLWESYLNNRLSPRMLKILKQKFVVLLDDVHSPYFKDTKENRQVTFLAKRANSVRLT